MFFLFGIIDSITDINYNKFLKTGFIALGPYFFLFIMVCPDQFLIDP